jgi:hypothetical protein
MFERHKVGCGFPEHELVVTTKRSKSNGPSSPSGKKKQ